jgi:VanZ family protein
MASPDDPLSAPQRTRLRVWLWLLTAAFVIYGTTIPFQFVDDLGLAAAKYERLSSNVFLSPDTGARLSTPDVVQNVLLFIPFGLLGMSTLRRGPFIVRLLLVTLLGALLSAGVEALQLFTVDRTTSIADLITNSTGAFLGAVLWPLAAAAGAAGFGVMQQRQWTSAPALYPAVVIALLLCVSAWQPFDPSLDLGSVWSKVKTLLADPVQRAAVNYEDLLQFFRFAAFAMAVAYTCRQLRVRSAATRAVIIALVFGASLESSQIILQSRLPSLADVSVVLAGALAGGLVYRAWRHDSATRPWFAIVSVVTVVSLVPIYLAPFTLADAYPPQSWVPFLSYYKYTSTQALSHVIEVMLMYFPIGFAAAAGRGNGYRGLAIVVTFATAAVLEYSQGWVIGRYPDVTDPGVALLGCAAGLWCGGTGWTRFSNRVERPSVAEPTRRPSARSADMPAINPAFTMRSRSRS